MQESKLVYYKDIQSKRIDWLWYPYIPFGKITIVQGDPGEGKTTFVLSLLSILSNGGKLPCSEKTICGKAIYQNNEDDNADTIKPRLEKHGADCDKICFIDKPGGLLSFDDEELERFVIESEAKILALDPIQAFIGENVDMNRANVVRPRMNKLKEIAEKTGCAIILVGHLNKNSGGKSNYRGLGSIDFSAAARSILLIGKMPGNDNVRIMAHLKSNLGPIGKSLAFSLDDGNVKWIGECELTANELMSSSGQEKSSSKQFDAKNLISSLLSDGPKPYQEILKVAERENISARTLKRAKISMNVVSTKKYGEWYWSLPNGK